MVLVSALLTYTPFLLHVYFHRLHCFLHPSATNLMSMSSSNKKKNRNINIPHRRSRQPTAACSPQQQQKQKQQQQQQQKQTQTQTQRGVSITTAAKVATTSTDEKSNGCLLVLHGNRQTGSLLLGRMEKLQKRLWKEFQLECLAPDAPLPHPADPTMRSWWNRDGNDYEGLETCFQIIQQQTLGNQKIVGVFGFSQGARLVHLLALRHEQDPTLLPWLRFVIMVAGYDAPLPDGCSNWMTNGKASSVPSLHVWGRQDSLVSPQQSETVTTLYQQYQVHIHDGKHCVPMKAPDLQTYVDFIRPFMDRDQIAADAADAAAAAESDSSLHHAQPNSSTPSENSIQIGNHKGAGVPCLISESASLTDNAIMALAKETQQPSKSVEQLQQQQYQKQGMPPDEETAVMQTDELEALEAIFPDEIKLVSKLRIDRDMHKVYDHPIVYQIKLRPSDDGIGLTNTSTNTSRWPKQPLTVQVMYPYNYPLEATPRFELIHENNIYEFPSRYVHALRNLIHETAQTELGMPSILSCLYAAKEFLDSPPTDSTEAQKLAYGLSFNNNDDGDKEDQDTDDMSSHSKTSALLKPSTLEEIRQCNFEGLAIAERLLQATSGSTTANAGIASIKRNKGGSLWTYTIGLVGKPSAGKSTFFNAATAFSRQRGDGAGGVEYRAAASFSKDSNNQAKPNNPNNEDSTRILLGGASMAPHPFTTIDPNIGYCLVPAPFGLCPEDDDALENGDKNALYGSTHGRDPQGRRFIPVLLKDVAGLVPGAYQGRGRGNQFLNDLCDATVLIHVLDASGTADAQGNQTAGSATDADDGDHQTDLGQSEAQFTNPLDDLAWIRNELVEWVYTNLMMKWETIRRKGRSKVCR